MEYYNLIAIAMATASYHHKRKVLEFEGFSLSGAYQYHMTAAHSCNIA